jgi:hypothetical protein
MTGTGVEAFIWDQANGMRRLAAVLLDKGATGLDGWSLTYANGIAVTATGKIVIAGKGVDPDGNSQAWRAVIVGYREKFTAGGFRPRRRRGSPEGRR